MHGLAGDQGLFLFEQPLDLLLDFIGQLTESRPVRGGDRAQLAHDAGQQSAFPAEIPHPEGLELHRVVDPGERRGRFLLQPLQFLFHDQEGSCPAVLTTAAKALGSTMARLESTLRSSSMAFLVRPPISRL